MHSRDRHFSRRFLAFFPLQGVMVAVVLVAASGPDARAAAPKSEPAQPAKNVLLPDTPAQGESSPGSGGKPRASLFGIESEGSKFVYVLDRSGSMGGSASVALKSAKTELLKSIKQLQQTQQFQIVFYNEKPTIFNPTGNAGRILFATEQNKDSAESFVDSISPAGGTRHDDALSMALKLQPSAIFWLTDADDPKLGPTDLARINRMAAGVVINAIEFGAGPQAEKDNFLVKIARENGGKHVYIDVSKLGGEKEKGEK
jgi:hypothetical protein